MHQNISSMAAQCEQMIRQMVNQTNQSTHMYQQMAQTEEQNARELDRLVQRERQTAQQIQQLLRMHENAIQQMNHVQSLCEQISRSASMMSQQPLAMGQFGQTGQTGSFNQQFGQTGPFNQQFGQSGSAGIGQIAGQAGNFSGSGTSFPSGQPEQNNQSYIGPIAQQLSGVPGQAGGSYRSIQ